jgi:hypothetical protein
VEGETEPPVPAVILILYLGVPGTPGSSITTISSKPSVVHARIRVNREKYVNRLFIKLYF